MKGLKYILSKQVQWAKRKNISLIGSQLDKGFPAYTLELNENLFEPLAIDVVTDISQGDGGEISTKNNFPARMNAVHSSSAIGVNIFHYWKTNHKIDNISNACGFSSKQNKTQKDLRFEQKFKISSQFNKSPNIDVVIENNKSAKYNVFAIECKFSEPYSYYEHSGVDPKYFNKDIMPLWEDIPKLFDLAQSISPNDNEYKFLHPAQLIKHILGLKNKFGKTKFKLLYLWYDVLGEEGFNHRNEIDKFKEYTKADNIKFSSISYQELITNLAEKYYTTNEEYINYITDRYL